MKYERCGVFSIALKRLWRDPGTQKDSFHFERIGLGMSLREVEMEEGYLHMQQNCAENIEWLMCSCSYLKLGYIKTKSISCSMVLHAACHLHFSFFWAEWDDCVHPSLLGACCVSCCSRRGSITLMNAPYFSVWNDDAGCCTAREWHSLVFLILVCSGQPPFLVLSAT